MVQEAPCCCANAATCCGAIFCPCIIFGKSAERMDKDCCTYGAGYCALGFVGLHWVLGTIFRMDYKREIGAEPNCCTSCLMHSFCSPCALTQENETLKGKAMGV